MAFTDHAVTAYVYPQDGGSSGISDFDADWDNAATAGGLNLAETKNYAPKGLGITADHTNEQFSVGSGLAFIEDTADLDFRVYSDSEQSRSATWTEGLLSVLHLKPISGVSFQTTSAKNYVYLYYTRSSQNDAYIRVADSQSDAPTNGIEIGQIDAGGDTKRETNRVAGHSRNYIGKYSCSGADFIDINVPDTYDEIILKFQGVSGSYSGGRRKLFAQANGETGYYQRTTQGSNTGITNFWLTHDYAARSNIIGEVVMTGRWPNSSTWSFSNKLTNRAGKYFAYAGWNDNMATGGTLDTIHLEWQSGTLTGTWALWGRDFV